MSVPKSKDQQIRAVDELLRGVELAHGVRSQSGWVRERSPKGGGDQAPRDHSSGRAPAAARPGRIDVIEAPGWSKHKWLLHGFSTRTGGRSHAYRSAPTTSGQERQSEQFGDLNLGFTAADADEIVRANRSDFLRAILRAPQKASAKRPRPGVTEAESIGREMKLVTLRQIHSSLLRRVDSTDAAASRKGDGLMTDEPGVMLGIVTADCIPVLIADPRQRAVAAFHAGWRGTVKRIVENGVGRMRLEFGSDPADMIAAIGPGIGQCCYAVGDEVISEFTSQFTYAKELFCEIYDSDPVRQKYPLLFLTARAPGHGPTGPATHLDLVEANKRQLMDAGLKVDSIFVAGECTSCRTDRFFSHRAEHGFTGRMLSVIGIKEDSRPTEG
ncbi:MAG TPA: peptidoglycan editing factor PgeF [Acidisarcina sp.]